jgi:DNA-binding NtrC family response regulator
MGKMILVVDDEPLIRKAIRESLERVEGYEVDEAEDGVQAVKLLENRHFDLVITDLVMPRMDGFKLFEHIQSMSPQIPVVVMTGYFSEEAARTSFPETECLIKPFGARTLLSSVHRCLAGETRRVTDH